MTALLARRERLEPLIANVKKTIKSMKGERIMSDREKFEGFLQKLVDENERRSASAQPPFCGGCACFWDRFAHSAHESALFPHTRG